MSFGTFWGTDPTNLVSYQKILPQYLPDNAPATSVIRIEDANPVVVPAPTVNNEALTVIDVAGELETFSVNPLAPIPADLTINGVCPYTAPNGDLDYLVWGHEPVAAPVGQRRGVIYIYSPNLLNASQGVWTKRFITDVGVPQTIIQVCHYNFANTISEGAIPPNAEYAIYGDFGTIYDADGNNPVVALILASWNTQNDVVSALPIAAGVGFDAPAPLYMIAIPTALSQNGSSKLLFYSPLLINHDGGTFQKVCQYSTTGGGQFAPIGTDANDGVSPAGSDTGIFSACFDYDNRLWLGGNFVAFQLSNAVPAFSTSGLVCLTFDVGGTEFNNVVNTGIVLTNINNIVNIRKKYAGQLGVDNQLVFSGAFTVALTAGGQATDCFYINTAYPAGTFSAVALSQQNNVAYEPLTVLLLDTSTLDTAYVATNLTSHTGKYTWGIDNSFVGGWDTIGGDLNTIFMNWYGKAINANPPRPLSYIVLQQGGAGGTIAYSGSYQAAQQTNITFAGGSVARYIKPSGAVGNATSAVIAQQYASFSLVADLAANVWDVIGTYGQVNFSP